MNELEHAQTAAEIEAYDEGMLMLNLEFGYGGCGEISLDPSHKHAVAALALHAKGRVNVRYEGGDMVVTLNTNTLETTRTIDDIYARNLADDF